MSCVLNPSKTWSGYPVTIRNLDFGKVSCVHSHSTRIVTWHPSTVTIRALRFWRPMFCQHELEGHFYGGQYWNRTSFYGFSVHRNHQTCSLPIYINLGTPGRNLTSATELRRLGANIIGRGVELVLLPGFDPGTPVLSRPCSPD